MQIHLPPHASPDRHAATEAEADTAKDAAADAADLAACRLALQHGSRTFLAASLMLPKAVREPACALYAFCRMADDAVDTGGDTALSVERLRIRLARACDRSLARSSLDSPADRALASVIERFGIPHALPEALLEGFEWDARGRRYETLDDLHHYAARVAGSVGAMMALLMNTRDPEAVARACELGVAMQLSNIARDVGEDAAMGRLYLPAAWMREAGIDPDAWLARPVFSAALASVVERLLSAADELYARVGAGVAALPLGCRPGINAARFMYADIGHAVRRAGHDSVSRRAFVPASRKLWLLLRALATLRPSSAGETSALPALSANDFLVAAVAATAPMPPHQAPRGIGERLVGVIELFDRLERKDRAVLMRRPTGA